MFRVLPTWKAWSAGIPTSIAIKFFERLCIMLERFLFSIIALLFFVAAVKAYGFLQRRQIRRRSQEKWLPKNIGFNTPTLIYFWTPECSQCKPQELQIEKAITGLRLLGKVLNVHKYNALEELVLAKEMQVMTVPTTMLMDSQGKIAAWNPGLTPSRKIVEQAQTIL
jgi:hypothetical protein